MPEAETGAALAPADHDARRLTAARRLVAVGAILGALGALALGLLGAPGSSGLIAVLAGMALGCVLGAIHLAALSLVDEARNRPVALRRPLWSLGLFVAAAALLVLAGGASASA